MSTTTGSLLSIELGVQVGLGPWSSRAQDFQVGIGVQIELGVQAGLGVH